MKPILMRSVLWTGAFLVALTAGIGGSFVLHPPAQVGPQNQQVDTPKQQYSAGDTIPGLAKPLLLGQQLPTAEENQRDHDVLLVKFQQPAPPKFKTGAKRTQQATIAKAIAEGSLKLHKATGTTPAQFAMIPKQMSMWLNDQYGDCVTAEEAAQIAEYTSALGTEYFVQDATVLAFCKKYDLLNGAELLPVIQLMQKDGFHQGTDTIQDGVSSVVDYSTESVLQNALSQGPVKIGIDSSALPSGAGNGNGWSKFGGRPGQYSNEDHAVNLTGYGSVIWLCQQLDTPVPAGAPASGYLLYTWDSIGIVDHAWIMSTVQEAYLRGPVIINGKSLPPLTPTPPPVTVSVPNVMGMDWVAAQGVIKGVGLVPTSSQTAGSVTNQSPVAGTQVAPGSTVTCTLSTTPPPPPPVNPGVVTSATLLFADGSVQKLINENNQRSVTSITYNDGTVQPVGVARVNLSDGSSVPIGNYTQPRTQAGTDGKGDWSWDPVKGVWWRYRPDWATSSVPIIGLDSSACANGSCGSNSTRVGLFGRWR